jgi:transposase
MEHRRVMLARHLEHIDVLDEHIASFDAQIAAVIEGEGSANAPPTAADAGAPVDTPNSREGSTTRLTWAEALEIWDSIPGVGRRVAEQLVAEVGVDMGQFRSAAHLASWAKLCPGTHESVGKRKTVRVGNGNNWLRSTLIQAAHAAVRTKDSYLAACYGRLVGRRGKKKALVAVAHKLLMLAYTLVRKGERWVESGTTYLDERQQDRVVHRLTSRSEHLGYHVNLDPGWLRPPEHPYHRPFFISVD